MAINFMLLHIRTMPTHIKTLLVWHVMLRLIILILYYFYCIYLQCKMRENPDKYLMQ